MNFAAARSQVARAGRFGEENVRSFREMETLPGMIFAAHEGEGIGAEPADLFDNTVPAHFESEDAFNRLIQVWAVRKKIVR